MSLDVANLQKVKRRGDTITARCPACAETGRDKTGNHLTVFPSGKWACVIYPGDKAHNKRIFELCGGEMPEANLKPLQVEQKPKAVPIGLYTMLQRWPEDGIADCAASLGVDVQALTALQARYAPQHRAWAFPMRDGNGNTIGIRLRAADGRKWAVQGSRNGIFLPPLPEGESCALICEGPTDTAAALTMGFYAIGRPSCSCGGDLIKTALKRLNVHRAVIVADADLPGQQGAQKVAKEIGVRSVIWTPAAKDLREFLQGGGTRQIIEAEISNFVWKR